MNIPGFTLLGFKRPREVVCQTLGKLERRVMEETWRCGEVSVREVFNTFNEQIAYTTVMTTLDRLHKKNLLSRRKDGRAFLYRPRVSRTEMEQGVTKDVIDGLLGSNASTGIEPVLACIVDAVSERDRELLDELDRLVKEKRRELRRQE
jgi:predicted transcriptional regulator